MARHLNFNPGRDSVAYLEAINCGENRLQILDQLLIALRGEIGRPNHQHHLLIGPRGSGKTHLLRILTAGRMPADPALSDAYLPIVMPEETSLRTGGDLLLKFVERLAEQLKEPPVSIAPEAVRTARGTCLAALTSARGMKDPLARLELMADTLDAAASSLGRILLPIAENMDHIFFLGSQRGRKGPLDEQWAIRRYLQKSSKLLMIGATAANTNFGAASDPDKPFYDFFRIHNLDELADDEVLEIIRLRMEYEAANPGPDDMRVARIRSLLDHFAENSPQLRGFLVVTGGLPRFVHLIYEVVVETDVSRTLDTLNNFLDELTPYFQNRLDPRLMPQPEIDLLHTLALARGPRQPAELAEALYGVSTNEVSELLSRLQERGLVKRAGRPGGQAVTWDLTEPLYRVWTQFRDNPDAQDLYRILGRIVAVLYTPQEIRRELAKLDEAQSCMPERSAVRYGINERCKVLTHADQYLLEKQPVSEESLTEALIESPEAKKARELYVTHYDAVESQNHEKVGALLEELRQLSAAYPDEASVRISLAGGLVNAIYAAGYTSDQSEAGLLLEELRQLSAAHPDEAPVRECLANGLFNVIYAAGGAGDQPKVGLLLAELRQLSAFHPDEVPVHEDLVKSLVNATYAAGYAGDQSKLGLLLKELRQLSAAHSGEALVRECLAKGLVNAIKAAGDAGDQSKAGLLVEELRQLSAAHPDEASVREELACGLFNVHYAAGNAVDQLKVGLLLEELRQLSAAHPDEAPVRNNLACALYNAIKTAGDAGDQSKVGLLFEELRQLSAAHPDEALVREMLAYGFVNVIYTSVEAGNQLKVGVLLYELLDLAVSYPDEIHQKVVELAFMAYGKMLLAMMKSGDTAGAKESMSQLASRVTGTMAEFVRPIKLAMDVLEKGEEQALAREPEEVRRVVRMIIDKSE